MRRVSENSLKLTGLITTKTIMKGRLPIFKPATVYLALKIY